MQAAIALPLRATVRRDLAVVAVLVVLCAASYIVAGWPNHLGSDWAWYRDGFDRFVAGQPIYRLSFLTGPYDYLASVAYNQPPWLLVLVAPFALLPEPLGREAWTIAMVVALAAALVVFLRGVRMAFVLPVLLSAPVLMLVVWGNVEPLVLLGIALWCIGRERDDEVLEGIGIALASIKVSPAIPLALGSLALRHYRALGFSILATLGPTAVLSLLQGHFLLIDFVLTTKNEMQIGGGANLAPSLWLPVALVRTAGLFLMVVGIGRHRWAVAVGQFGACLIPLNLYVDWLLAVVLPLLSKRQAILLNQSTSM